MRLCLISAVLFLATLAACTRFPDLDAAVTPGARTAGYPDLLPAEELRARVPEARLEEETPGSIEARIAGLRARAARLRGTVIDSESRSRMQSGIPAN